MIRPLRMFVFDTARLYRVHSRTPACLVVVLRRGHHMEKAEAPEHRPFHWSYNESFANRLGVDVERNSDEVRQGKSERESDQPGEPFSAVLPDR